MLKRHETIVAAACNERQPVACARCSSRLACVRMRPCRVRRAHISGRPAHFARTTSPNHAFFTLIRFGSALADYGRGRIHMIDSPRAVLTALKETFGAPTPEPLRPRRRRRRADSQLREPRAAEGGLSHEARLRRGRSAPPRGGVWPVRRARHRSGHASGLGRRARASAARDAADLPVRTYRLQRSAVRRSSFCGRRSVLDKPFSPKPARSAGAGQSDRRRCCGGSWRVLSRATSCACVSRASSAARRRRRRCPRDRRRRLPRRCARRSSTRRLR